MKGGLYRLRARELALVTIVLMCTTFLIWAWEKTPLLTAFLPPQTQLQLTPDIIVSKPVAGVVFSESQIIVGKDVSSFPEKLTENDEGLNLDLADPENSVQSSPTRQEINSDLLTTTDQNGEIHTNVSEEEAKDKQIQEAEKKGGVEGLTSPTEVEGKNLKMVDQNSKQVGQILDMVTRTGSPSSSSVVGGKDDRNLTILKENQEIHTNVSEEEAKDKQIQEAEKKGVVEGPTSPTEVEGKNLKMVDQNSKQVGQILEMVTGTGSPSSSSVVGGKDDRNLTILKENQACNYAKGKWVPDNNRPLYSGFDCKQWLSGMWACRLTQRTDFAYEKLQWQPKYCQMEEFEGSKFLRKMQGKTLAFVGDSLGRQQYQSLMCMITGGKERHDVIDVRNEYGIIQARGNARPNGWAYRFPSTNTTILYYWSASLCDVEPIDKTNPTTDYAMHLDRPPAFLRQFLHKFDVLVLNTGHHWNRGKLKANKWVMYVGGVPNTNKNLAMIWKAKNLTVYSIVDWVNSQLPKYPGLKAFYRTISPRHFVGGDWNTGGSCDKTTPMSVGIEVLQDKSSDESAAGAVKGTGVKLLDITALSQLRDEGHISRFSQSARSGVQDCLHWCLPGVPDTWNEILFAQI